MLIEPTLIPVKVRLLRFLGRSSASKARPRLVWHTLTLSVSVAILELQLLHLLGVRAVAVILFEVPTHGLRRVVS